MVDAKYDVLGIGNAIFDLLAKTDEKFLADHVDSRLHVCHLSTAGSAAIVSAAKDRGTRVTAPPFTRCFS